MIGRFPRTLARRGWLVALVIATSGLVRAAESAGTHGLPFIRSYSLGDIGNVPRGSQLGFDRYGRVAAMHEGVYSVLNDNVWLNLAEPGGKGRVPILNVVQAPDGRSYYGARGSWGVVATGQDGLLHPVALVPASRPEWIATAAFGNIIATRTGVYFASTNGVVFWDFKRGENVFFAAPRLSRAFLVGDRVYLSAYGAPLRFIDPATEKLRDAAGVAFDGVVEFSATLDATRTLVAFAGGGLALFDGRRVTPWLPAGQNPIKGHVAVLQHLVDGRIAVAVTGQGLLLFSAEGELGLALTTLRYSNISALANREPGVLWVATDDSIDKVLYGSPLSTFGDALGLPVSWPIVARWNRRLYVSSYGKLYVSLPGSAGEPTRFELCPSQPPGGTFSLAAWGPHMLVGNGAVLFAANPDGTYHPVPTIGDLAHLVMVDEDHCYAIGHDQIGLLEWRDGHWREAAPRIPGLRNPAIVHRVGHSVWIEMGGDGVARLWANAGQLHLDVVANASWTKSSWVNVGAIGDIVVLSSAEEEPRRFFDEKTGRWCAAPKIQQLLNRSPFWIARAQQDPSGVIWATHNEGVVRFSPNGNGYDMDATSFDLVNDRYPIVRVLPDGDVWMFAERSLYHIERAWPTIVAGTPKPVLVSLTDAKHNTELLTAGALPSLPLRLPYESNSLSFRFYADGDAWRRTPAYEYRLTAQESWTPFDGSLLNLRTLSEGRYYLQVRILPTSGNPVAATAIEFVIFPPWYRSWAAYGLMVFCGVGVLVGVVRWSTNLTRKRNRMLERVVQERTSQLEATMAKLNEETRNTATLAERNRLANEIHDSVQQGLTGAILQLDTTLKLPTVASDLRSRLSVARNMVSYARQEVQNAVWDMESPLLEGTDLADAVRNLTAFVNSGDAEIDVAVSGEAWPLPRDVSHHLLRIAQEATTNAFRHARARRISIRLDYRGDPRAVALEVVDDGVGFAVDDVLRQGNGHLGLRGIRIRAKKVRGNIMINSTANLGTSIRIVVPVAAEKSESPDAIATSS